MTAILDGRPHVGLSPDEEKRVLQGTRKVAERDLAVAQAQAWAVGVTTVSATVALAHAAGISVFATGGIGGVHRGSELSGDVSADLDAIANHPVITVCAGAKAFLDLPRTLEYLETAGVPVLGWRHDWFPAFYTRSSGLPIPHRVDDEAVVCDVLRFRARSATGVLLTVPIPVDDEIPASRINAVLTAALDASARAGIAGPAVTPYVLARIEKETDGESVPANLALARNNADLAARIAVDARGVTQPSSVSRRLLARACRGGRLRSPSPACRPRTAGLPSAECPGSARPGPSGSSSARRSRGPASGSGDRAHR